MTARPRRYRIWFALAFGLALAVTGFFAARFVVSAIHWSDPASRDAAIEGWMPLRYVARSWDVPPEAIGAALGLEEVPGARRSVAELAAERGQTVPEMAAEIRAAIMAIRAGSAPEPVRD
jgi:hypothetical protein